MKPQSVLPRQISQSSAGCRIRAIALEGLREVLTGYGVELSSLLSQVSIADGVLKDDLNWIPLEKFADLMTLAAKATGDPCFGLKCGASAPLANPVGYLMSSAPDLRTALRAFSHYQRMFNTNAETFSEHAGVGRIEWTYPITMSDVAQLTDFVLMRFIIRIRSAAGPSWRPLAVSVTHHELCDRTEYERRVGTRISFGQPSNSIQISNQTLSRRIPTADPELFKLVKRFCEQQLEFQRPTDDLLDRIREILVRGLQNGDASPRLVAAELDLTPGCLHRLLKERGTSFQQLVDDTRRCAAERYLFESSLPLGEIASRVGYSELSAFSRAAHRWFGCSPREFRRKPERNG